MVHHTFNLFRYIRQTFSTLQLCILLGLVTLGYQIPHFRLTFNCQAYNLCHNSLMSLVKHRLQVLLIGIPLTFYLVSNDSLIIYHKDCLMTYNSLTLWMTGSCLIFLTLICILFLIIYLSILQLLGVLIVSIPQINILLMTFKILELAFHDYSSWQVMTD